MPDQCEKLKQCRVAAYNYSEYHLYKIMFNTIGLEVKTIEYKIKDIENPV